MPPTMGIPIRKLQDNPNVLDQFSQCLDRAYPHIKYWIHFAHMMEVNNDVISQCKLRSEKSPTIKLFDYLKAKRPQLTIKELISALSDVGRKDLCRMIRIFDDEDKVSKVITDSSSEMMDDIALELDSAYRPVGNWRNLAQKLELTRNVYEKFKMYSDSSPTVSLVQYLYAASKEPIPLKHLLDVLKEMDRQDAVDEITKVTGPDVEELYANNILKLGSDLLEKVAELLNSEKFYLKGWRELGRGFSVDHSIIESLEGPQDMEVCSPTKRIIKYLAANNPSTTISDIVRALEKIKRNDAIKILRSHFSIDVSYDRSNIEEFGIIPDLDGLEDIETHHDTVNRACATPTNTTLFGIQATEPIKTMVFEEDANRNFGVPSKTIEIIGRTDEKHELLKSLTEGQYQMLVLRAAKGYGKTTLVVNVAHEIIEDPYCYTVVYVDSKNVFSLTDLAYKILKTCSISSSQNHPVSQVIDLFSHSHKNCVLILENLDHMYHSIDKMNQTSSSQTGSNAEDDFPWRTTDISSKKEEFQDFLKDITKSAPKLKIVVTTWESVAFLTIKVKQMTLNLLNDGEALELLRSRSDMQLEDEVALEPIIKCCGGIPLLLCSAMVVLSEQGMADGVQMLASSPPEKLLRNLCPVSLTEEERLDRCLEICFERMAVHLCSKQVLVLLSVFPSAFTLEEAKHIAKGGELDDDQLEEGFQALKKFCFLNEYDLEAETYILHPAVRSFGISKAREEDELEKLFKAARWRFILCTFDILIKVEDEFFSTQSRSAIQKYRSQDENIREIARWCITDSRMEIKVKQFCIQSFISSQYVLLKIMKSHLLKLILCTFAQLCQKSDNSELNKLYCECLIMGGAKIVIGCLCTPYICHTALKEADWCFLKVFKALASKNSTRTTDTTVQDLASFEVLKTIYNSDVLSDKAKANFLIKCGKCLVRYGNQELGFYYIQHGIKIRSVCFKDSPGGKGRVMVAIGCNDLAGACTYVRQHTDAVLLRKEYVLPIYEKELGMHPFTATAYSQLARNYLELGEYDKAIKANDIALRYRQALLGNHQETARSLFDKSSILADRASSSPDPKPVDSYEEALGYLEKAFEMQWKLLDSPEETAKTLQEMIFVLNALGRTEEAKQREEELAKLLKKADRHFHCKD